MRSTRKLVTTLGLAAAGILLVATPAAAAVAFDPATGSGFVGKGDVQLAFGWNNSALQKSAGSVSFSYSATDTYAAVCSFVTGEGTRGEKTHHVSHTTTTAVSSDIAYDPRVKNQITGFNLTGLGATTRTGAVPEVGGVCSGNAGHGGAWTAVEQTSSSGGLYATHGPSHVLIG